VASIFSRVDSLAHVLAWGREGVGLVRVELPRIGTAFEPKQGPHGEPWLFNCDLQELALAEEVPSAVMALCRGLPDALVLRDRENAFHVLVPNAPLKRRRANKQPLYNFSVVGVDSSWPTRFRSRYFVFTVHTSQLFLEADTLASQLYLTWCLLCHRCYFRAAQSAQLCKCDRPLTGEEQYFLAMFADKWDFLDKSAQDEDPFTVAVQLKLGTCAYAAVSDVCS
jgi:hypothetical protein